MIIVEPRSFLHHNVRDLRVVFHDIPDADGKSQRTKCVEYTVVGNRTEWPDWALFEEFVRVNPGVQIEDTEE
jgi:hypothetical protein